MRKGYGEPSIIQNMNSDFGFSQDGFLTTDMSGTYHYQQPQMYDPTSYNPDKYPITMQSDQPYAGFSMPNDFMTNAALQYGSTMMEQGTDILQRNMEKYVPTSKLKYYFAVDNMYVAKKLSLLIFPFLHTNWAVQYNHDKQPVPPRYDINAPDLYIPMMALLTYILNCGFMFGIHGQFSPEQLGIMASNAVGWLVFEILLLGFILYIINAKSSLRFIDMIAFSGYKFVGMNFVLLSSVLFQFYGYYSSLAYFSIALGYFLIRTLKIQIMPSDVMSISDGNKRRIYLLMITALIQPVVMWLLTRSVVTK